MFKHHLCGAVLTETFFVMVVSKSLCGKLQAPGTIIICILLLGIFAIKASEVPGGIVMASLGLITSVLGFDLLKLPYTFNIYPLRFLWYSLQYH